MNKPLLSICIPTYNRSQYLKELLDSIVIQFSNPKIKEMVEVVISDNASVDDTTAVVKEYQKRFNNVHYFRNDENVGAPQNVSAVLQMGVGKYLWLLGDDDLVIPYALDLILSNLTDSDYGAVLLNFSQGEHVNAEIIMMSNCLHVKEDKSYDDYRSFFEGEDFKNFFGINFISAIIFNRERFRLTLEDSNKYINTCYYQSYIFLYCAKVGKLLRLAKPMVIWRSWEKERRYDEFQRDEGDVFKSYFDYIELANCLGYSYDQSKLDLIKKRRIFLLENYWSNILRENIGYILDFFNIKDVIKKIYRLPRSWRFKRKKYE